jgi:hypothetical protein
MVITPNQTLTLQDVPTDEGGTAAGMQQTSQRIGSSIGIALVASVFFTVLASSGQDYGAALSTGLIVVASFVTAAFVLGFGDILRGRRRQTSDDGPPDTDTDTDTRTDTGRSEDGHRPEPIGGGATRHCDRGHASAGRSPAGHSYH